MVMMDFCTLDAVFVGHKYLIELSDDYYKQAQQSRLFGACFIPMLEALQAVHGGLL